MQQGGQTNAGDGGSLKAWPRSRDQAFWSRGSCSILRLENLFHLSLEGAGNGEGQGQRGHVLARFHRIDCLTGPAGLFAAWAFQQGGWRPPTATEDQEHFYTHSPETTVGMAELDLRNPDLDAEEHHAPDAWADAERRDS